MDLDIDRTKKSLSALGLQESMFHLNDTDNNNIFVQLEKGELTEHDFFIRLKEIIGKPLPDTVLKKVWNEMIVDFKASKIKLLQELRHRYHTFLLSNTNEIHIARCNEIIYRKYDIPSLDELFEKTYYSHVTGMRKPEPEIFEYVLHESKLNPSETLFIDDSAEHIKTAKESGMHVWLHVRNAPLEISW